LNKRSGHSEELRSHIELVEKPKIKKVFSNVQLPQLKVNKPSIVMKLPEKSVFGKKASATIPKSYSK